MEILPNEGSIVKNKWAFQIEVKANGAIEHFKVRLVAIARFHYRVQPTKV